MTSRAKNVLKSYHAIWYLVKFFATFRVESRIGFYTNIKVKGLWIMGMRHHHHGSWAGMFLVIGIGLLLVTQVSPWALFGLAFFMLPMMKMSMYRYGGYDRYEQEGDVIVVDKRKNSAHRFHNHDSDDDDNDDAQYIRTQDGDWLEVI